MTNTNVTTKTGDRIRVTALELAMMERAATANETLVTVLGDENVILSVERTNLRRNGRTLFNVQIDDGSAEGVTRTDGLVVDEVDGFLRGLETACAWFSRAAEAHAAAEGEDTTGEAETAVEDATEANAADVLAEAA